MSYTPATDALIQALQLLPGVGTRSAQRMALHLLERDPESASHLNKTLSQAIEKVHKCPECRSLTEVETCSICTDLERDKQTICIVSNDADKAGIEMSGRYKGLYFVLHGVLSPIDGVGPEELGIAMLLERVAQNSVVEVIIALDEQMESEATSHYLSMQLKSSKATLSRIRFSNMKNGNLDAVDSHLIVNAIKEKQTIGFEHD